MKKKIQSRELLISETLLKFFLKKGNYKSAQLSVKTLFERLFKKTSLGQYSILNKIYKILYINFEVRKIKK